MLERDQKVAADISNEILQGFVDDQASLFRYIALQKENWKEDRIEIYTASGKCYDSTGTETGNGSSSEFAAEVIEKGKMLRIVGSEEKYAVAIDSSLEINGSAVVAAAVVHNLGSLLEDAGMLDLSAEDFVQNYQSDALEECQIDGKLYYLPGPSSVYGIVYDRTMFSEHGWQVPHSYDEFLSLVGQIEAEGIRAIQPTCKYARQAQAVLTMFNYADTFGGVDDYQWLLDYQKGKTSMVGTLDAALERYQEMNRAGIILPGDFDVQPGNRSNMLYNDHTCAMIIENEQAVNYAEQAGSDHEYGMFPFWSGNGEGDDYLMSQPGYYIGLNRLLGTSGNEAKLAKVKEVIRYISTPEGQLAISGGTMKQISNVTGTDYPESDFNSEIMDTISRGNLVPEVDLMASGNNNAAEKMLQTDLRKMLEGTVTPAVLEADCDDARTKALSAGVGHGETVGQASENFTCLETGLFIADALRQKAGADIGLCLVGTTHCGMVKVAN